MNLKKRIEKLEAEPIRINGKTLDEMSDEELALIVAGNDPIGAALLDEMPDEELQRLADGDPTATAAFKTRIADLEKAQ